MPLKPSSSLRGRSFRPLNSKLGGWNNTESNTDEVICRYLQYLLFVLVLCIIGVGVVSVLPSHSADYKKRPTLEMSSRVFPQLNAVKHVLKEDGAPLAFGAVLQRLSQGDTVLMSFLNHAITSRSEAVFWECIPVSRSELETTNFEFVVIDSPVLAARRVNVNEFKDKFVVHQAAKNPVIVFQNLGLDATLVAPSPPSGPDSAPQHMTHLAAFLREATHEQKVLLWKTAAKTMLERLQESDKRYWLSTSGLGVSWLHVRIDEVPKYYNWLEYKRKH